MVYVNGKRIRELRQAKGMSQEELAEAAGVSQPMIAHIEAGRKQPGITALKLTADSFGVPMDDLLIGN